MKFIPVNQPLLNGNEKRYLNECIDSGWISSEGPFVKEFESKFAQRHGRKYGIAVANGTAALKCALEAIELKAGDEVIVPSFTIICCVTAILEAGGTPILVDCDPVTFNSSPEQIVDAITPRTKAIMLVHIYGLPVDADPILKIANDKGIKVIEDVAEVIGLNYKKRPCGSLGQISTFSFYPNKHITTGEGGMILTDCDIIADKCRSSRNLCFQKKRRFYHEQIGWNYRMTNLQAAIGLAQLERLDEFIEKKRRIGELYSYLLKDFQNIQIPLSKTNYARNIYWVYGIVLLDKKANNALSMIKRFESVKIETRPFFYPMHLQPVFQKMGMFKNKSLPNSERLANQGFYLPSGVGIKKEEIETVARYLKQFLKS